MSRHLADLPGPRPWPLLGNLPQQSPVRMHRQVEAWARQYGPLFAMRFAATPVLVVAEPILVGGVLRDRPEGFRRPSATAQVAMEMDGRPGLIVAEGAAWRAQRRMIMAALAPHAVKAYFPALVATGLRLRERWRQAAQTGTGIALAVDLKCYSIDIIAGLAFGIEVNTLEHGEHVLQRHMDIILAGVARRSMAPFPYWRYLRLARKRELDASVAALRATVDQLSPARARGSRPDRHAASSRPTCSKQCCARHRKRAAASTTILLPAMLPPCCWPARKPPAAR